VVTGLTETPLDDGIDKPIFGIIANNTYSQGATILDNTITRATYGVQAQGVNKRLNVICNDFTLNGTAIMTTKGLYPSLAVGMKSQGTGCGSGEYRAGNKFNEGSNGMDIKSTLTSAWNYYAFKSNNDNSQRVDNSAGPLNITTCNMGATIADPTSQCNKLMNCIYAAPREDIAIHRSVLRTIALGGMKYDAEGQALIGTIVNAYNDSDDDAGLIEFFEDQGDENAYRLLIPLYIEAARYTDIDTPIARMSIDSAEKAAYKSYYEILIDLKESDRRPNQLTGGEYSTVETLAEALTNKTIQVGQHARNSGSTCPEYLLKRSVRCSGPNTCKLYGMRAVTIRPLSEVCLKNSG
jgi:hypothetical protein